jgi:hypothetical protein
VGDPLAYRPTQHHDMEVHLSTLKFYTIHGRLTDSVTFLRIVKASDPLAALETVVGNQTVTASRMEGGVLEAVLRDLDGVEHAYVVKPERS